MSMYITYRVCWQLSEHQLTQLEAIKTKHEQSDAYRGFHCDDAIESLMMEPREPIRVSPNQELAWWGSVAYPSGLDMLELEAFQEIVLGFVSELRRTFGGKGWEVYLFDNEEPAKWHKEIQTYY